MMDGVQPKELLELVELSVHDLCYPLVELTENGVRVCICEKDIVFTFEEILAARTSAKDFLDLLKKRIWERK